MESNLPSSTRENSRDRTAAWLASPPLGDWRATLADPARGGWHALEGEAMPS
jgi:hypothetical protein